MTEKPEYPVSIKLTGESDVFMRFKTVQIPGRWNGAGIEFTSPLDGIVDSVLLLVPDESTRKVDEVVISAGEIPVEQDLDYFVYVQPGSQFDHKILKYLQGR